MPVLEYRLFCVVSYVNVKNIGFLNVYQYSRYVVRFIMLLGFNSLHLILPF
jgi:hypothetical protein